jgi:uncharacterized DUF497 family protein
MEIEFDPAKDEANRARHGISLSRAVEMDLSAALVVQDDRKDYGETRYRAFGPIDGQAHCLVFTIRAGSVRVISLRRAHEKEVKRQGE